MDRTDKAMNPVIVPNVFLIKPENIVLCTENAKTYTTPCSIPNFYERQRLFQNIISKGITHFSENMSIVTIITKRSKFISC